MNSYWKLYWLTRLTYLQGIFLALGIIFGFIIFIHIIVYLIEGKAVLFKKSWQLPTYTTLFIISILMACLIPDRNEAIFIIAGGKTLEFIKKDSSINKIPAQTTSIISQFLQQQIDKLDKPSK